jgi:hypothetical protein
MLELFTNAVTEKATFYERYYVAAICKRLADEIKATQMLESIMRHEYSKRRW